MQGHLLMKISKEGLRAGLLLSLFLVAAIAGTLYLRKVSWRDTLVILKDFRDRKKALKPFVRRAKELDIRYDEALFAPERYIGQPVVWDVKIPKDPHAFSYVNEDLRLPVRWLNPPAALPGALEEDLCGGGGHGVRTFTIVGLIHDVSPPESLRKLTGKKYAGLPYYVTLQYLGCL
jgi:hypothetical protein